MSAEAFKKYSTISISKGQYNIIFIFLLGKSIGTRVFYYFLELYNNITNVCT